MLRVKKRDGAIVDFDITKIEDAMKKAFDATNTPVTQNIEELMALRVSADVNPKIKDGVVSIEDIQDSVNTVLIQTGYVDVAKSYMDYRKKHDELREIKSNELNYVSLVNNYIHATDWRVKENSTVTYSLGGLSLSNSGAVVANYWLSQVYDKEIADAHRDADIHIHDLSMLSGYCAGWSLKQLIKEGLGGVPGKITSAPAKHLMTICNQMVNFYGVMQEEWAGAQAFSSFDTYLAPFVKADGLSYKETKQCIQSFLFGVNTPSRWGCVPDDTEVLTTEGFKKREALRKGDMIYTWKDARLAICRVNEIVEKHYKGKMHVYYGEGYEQMVSPDHRVLIKKDNIEEYEIQHSSDIFNSKTKYSLPTCFVNGSSITGADMNDDEIIMAAMIYSDGDIDMKEGSLHKIDVYESAEKIYSDDLIKTTADNLNLQYSTDTTIDNSGSSVNRYTFYGASARRISDLIGNTKTTIDKKFLCLNQRQSDLFLRAWACFGGGSDEFEMPFNDPAIGSQLQQIAVLAGKASYAGHSGKGNCIKMQTVADIVPKTKEVDYDGIIWCPNDDNGTAVFRRNGCVFISGQCQAPFTNVTIDWKVPDDLKNLPAIVGGKEMPFTYGDCQKEADMINKAFIESMIEGDANGRGFQYPIPTYSITKDFDWSDTENNELLFTMTAKYGTPYFSNYLNSDMKPSDVRSMAIIGTQNIIYKDKVGRISKDEIRNIVKQWNSSDEKLGKYQFLMNGKFVPVTEMFDIDYSKYDRKIIKITLDNGYEQRFSIDHKCAVIRDGVQQIILSQDVKPGDSFLLAKHGYNESTIGTKETGEIIGIYLANGWHEHNGADISFAINIHRKDIADKVISFFERNGCRTKCEEQKDVSIYRVAVFGQMAGALMSQFIAGNKATEKRLKTTIFDTSIEFRQGVYDGYYESDGSPSCGNFAHTTNQGLTEDLEELGATIGKYFRYSVNSNNTRYFKKDKSDFERFTSYKLNVFEPNSFNEDFFTIPVKAVDTVQTSTVTHVYNFTVDTKEHLYTLPNGIITHQCCRLRLEIRELRKRNGGFFGSGDATGSVGVVTINMPRIGYLSSDKDDFYKRLDHMMDISARSLEIKRKTITDLYDRGLYPYTKHYLGDVAFHNHFSTIGLIGMNEACLNAKWLKEDLTHKESQDFTVDVLNHMRKRLSDYQVQYPGTLFNLEATPAESTAFRLAKHDRERYPDIITAGKSGETPYYTNSSHLPVSYTSDIFSALDIEDRFQTLYTSGTVFHAFLGQRLPDWQSCMSLVRKIATNYKLPYYTMSPTYSICEDHGYIAGEKWKCPICGKDTEVYSRITGYYRPVKNWNDGKAQEFKDRKTYAVDGFVAPHSEDKNCSCEEEHKVAPKVTELMLFTSPTCPNCKMAKAMLDKEGIAYKNIDAMSNTGLVTTYGITKAPTLLVPDGESFDVYDNASLIRGYIETVKPKSDPQP